LRPGHFARDPGDPEFSETGLFGDPTLASADKGKQVLDIMTRRWIAALRGFFPEPLRTGR